MARQTTRSGARRGLSLVEVLVAVAITAGAVVAVVALLGPAVWAARDNADRRTALRLVETIDAELRRGGFTAVAAATSGGGALELVARMDGSAVVLAADVDNDPVAGVPRGIVVAERYFRIRVADAAQWRGEAACRVLEVRVSWPWRLPPDGAEVPEAQRAELVLHTAINR